jgi:hypothetical protein
MSYEAIAWVRRRSDSRAVEAQEKWVTIQNNCREEAVRTFNELGWILFGGLQILTQEEATERASRL